MITTKPTISEVEVTPIKPQGGLIGFASVVINGSLYLGFIGIHKKLGGGFRLTYPTKNIGDKPLNIYHPINRDTSATIEGAVIDKLKDVMRDFDAGSGNQFQS